MIFERQRDISDSWLNVDLEGFEVDLIYNPHKYELPSSNSFEIIWVAQAIHDHPHPVENPNVQIPVAVLAPDNAKMKETVFP